MSLEETQKLVKRMRKAEAADELVEPMLQELLLGLFVNVARIAEAMGERKPGP